METNSTHFGLLLLHTIERSDLARYYKINREMFIGITSNDSNRLEAQQSVKFLPKIYIEFMEIFGVNAFPLYPNDIMYSAEELAIAKDIAIETLIEDKSVLQLSESAYIFEAFQ